MVSDERSKESTKKDVEKKTIAKNLIHFNKHTIRYR